MQNLILPNRTETVWGRRYLLFQYAFLGSFLRLGAQLLGIRLTAVTLNLLFFTVNFIVTVLLCRDFHRRSFRLFITRPGKMLLTAAVGFGVYELAMFLLSLLIYRIDPEFANINDSSIASMSRENFAVMAVGTVLLVPLTEETLHRGILFGSLYRRSRAAAYAVSTAVFALVHIGSYIGHTDPLTLALCFIQYVPAGICLAAAYEYSGSLIPSVLIHAAVNALGMAAMR